MGAKNSKVTASPGPGSSSKLTTINANEDASTSSKPKSKKKTTTNKAVTVRKRKKTLNPQKYQGREVLAAIEAENALNNSSLNVRNKLSDSKHSLRSEATFSVASWYTDNSSVELIQYMDYEYPFENVVFEGGGNKGLAYAGAVRELERVGVWGNIKRMAGASAGAMFATLLAIGYNSYEIEEFLGMNLKKYFLDARCGHCSLLPNLLKNFGWHPAERLFEWFGDRLEEMTGDADTTFKQLYDQTGKELCIVVTNLNLMDAEYCHVKTTPDMPIRMAVRMSLSIPGLFGAVRSQKHNATDFYVDGGLLCNYPIHCFDGWWLSMKPGDSFLSRLHPLEDIGKLWDKKERFGTESPRTIGLLLYSSDEQDVMVGKLQNQDTNKPRRPDTKLSRKREKMKEIEASAIREHAVITAAMSGFLRLLSENDIDQSGTITREELEHAFSKEVDYFTNSQRRDLFGDYFKVKDIFDFLNHEKDDEITFHELQMFAERRGVAIQSTLQGYSRRNIDTFSQFLSALTDTLLLNVKRIFTTDNDITRTIGIDTVYIDTTDFELENGDKKFLVEQGERAVRSWLRRYVRLNDPPLKRELRGGSITESTFPADDLRRKMELLKKDSRERETSNEGSQGLTWSNVQKHTQNGDHHIAPVDGAMPARSAMRSPHRSPVLQRMVPPIRVAPPQEVVDDENRAHSDYTTREYFEPIKAEQARSEDMRVTPTRTHFADDLMGSARDLNRSPRGSRGSAHNSMGSERNSNGSARNLNGSARDLGRIGGRLPPIRTQTESSSRRTLSDAGSVNDDEFNSAHVRGSRDPSPRSESRSPRRMKRGNRQKSNRAYDLSEL